MTMGIPRLREILMTASKNIALPVMTLPLHPHCTRKHADDLAIRLSRISLAQVSLVPDRLAVLIKRLPMH